MFNREFIQQTNLPILDQVLSPSRIGEFTKSSYWREGGFGIIYRSNSVLTPDEQEKISQLLGRFPSQYLVFKVPKNAGIAEQQLVNELGMLTDPFVQQFAVACSGFKTDALGRKGLLLELAEGYDLENPEDVAQLQEDDFATIAYQLARVYQRFHDKRISPNDIRGLVYRKEFDPENPRSSAFPPRIILYDLAWNDRVQTEGEERHIDIWRDVLEYFKNLQTMFAEVPKFKLKSIQKLVGNVASHPVMADSFDDIADEIDRSFDYRIGENFRLFARNAKPTIYEITEEEAKTPKLTDKQFGELLNRHLVTAEEFSDTLIKRRLVLDPQKYTLGKDAYITEGLLGGSSSSPAHYVELYIGDLIEHLGLRTKQEIIEYVHSSRFPKSDLQDCLVPHPKEGTLLIALLSKLEKLGVITRG